jgi:hypothetical protein
MHGLWKWNGAYSLVVISHMVNAQWLRRPLAIITFSARHVHHVLSIIVHIHPAPTIWHSVVLLRKGTALLALDSEVPARSEVSACTTGYSEFGSTYTASSFMDNVEMNSRRQSVPCCAMYQKDRTGERTSFRFDLGFNPSVFPVTRLQCARQSWVRSNDPQKWFARRQIHKAARSVRHHWRTLCFSCLPRSDSAMASGRKP